MSFADLVIKKADGTVLYDDEADAGALPNHADRPEIRQAMDTGEGEIVRTSDTFNMNTFYYALRLNDGTVLRLAVDARSISSVFLAAVPVLLIIAVVIFAVCLLLGHLLTAQLIAPIDDMAEHLDEPAREPVYQELEPFARKIRCRWVYRRRIPGSSVGPGFHCQRIPRAENPPDGHFRLRRTH